MVKTTRNNYDIIEESENKRCVNSSLHVKCIQTVVFPEIVIAMNAEKKYIIATWIKRDIYKAMYINKLKTIRCRHWGS